MHVRPERELKKSLKIRKCLFEKTPKAPAGKPCANRELSNKPFYRAKMPATATPVVHGNRPAARMPHNLMTALGSAGGGAKRPSRLRRSRNGAGSLPQAFRSLRVRSRQACPESEGPGRCFPVRARSADFSQCQRGRRRRVRRCTSGLSAN